MLKNQKDFAAGVFYIAIGLFGATTLGDNEIGTLSRMGPGYFPLIIATMLMLTGLAIVVKALLAAPPAGEETRIDWGRPKAPLLILGSEDSGLVVSKPEVLDRVAQEILGNLEE